MSYRNPNITYTDPLAFAKGLKSGFEEAEKRKEKKLAKEKLEQKEKEEQRRYEERIETSKKIREEDVAYREARVAEGRERYEEKLKIDETRYQESKELTATKLRKKEQKEDEAANAVALSKVDLTGVQNVGTDAKKAVTDAYKMIAQDYADQSPAQKVKTLQFANTINTTINSISDILTSESETLDKRNDPFIRQLRNDVILNRPIEYIVPPDNPLGLYIKLSDGSQKTFEEIAGMQVRKTTEMADKYESLTDQIINNIAVISVQNVERKDKAALDNALKYGRSAFKQQLNNEEAVLSWAFYNEISDKAREESEALGLNDFFDQNFLQNKSLEEQNDLKQKQKDIIINDLFDQETKDAPDPNLITEATTTAGTQGITLDEAKTEYNLYSQAVERSLNEELFNTLSETDKGSGVKSRTKNISDAEFVSALNGLEVAVFTSDQPDVFTLQNRITSQQEMWGRGQGFDELKAIIRRLSIPSGFTFSQRAEITGRIVQGYENNVVN